MSGATLGAIKYAVGYTYYGSRHIRINKNMSMGKCIRCNKCETWKHLMQCEVVTCENKAFMIALRSKLEKEVETEERCSIEHILSDMQHYLLGNEEECMTNQVLLDLKYAFRGYVAKT